MYESYFGLRERPFNITPDPRFFYDNAVYREAYATLLYGVQHRRGFIVLTGEVGTGKTTLLRRLMSEADTTTTCVYIYNTTLGFDDLLRVVCDELGLPTSGTGLVPRVQALNAWLIEQLREGRTAALLIDEAQNLHVDVLENLRLLSNLETDEAKLLQIVLVGQPELDATLDEPGLRQLRQRIAVRSRLDRLKEAEVGPFIDKRLRSAGYEGRSLFTPEAVRLISAYSKGVPRLINTICDNALLLTYGAGEPRVSAATIGEVTRDLRLDADANGGPDAVVARVALTAGPEGPTTMRRWAAQRGPGVVTVGGALALLVVGGLAVGGSDLVGRLSVGTVSAPPSTAAGPEALVSPSAPGADGSTHPDPGRPERSSGPAALEPANRVDPSRPIPAASATNPRSGTAAPVRKIQNGVAGASEAAPPTATATAPRQQLERVLPTRSRSAAGGPTPSAARTVSEARGIAEVLDELAIVHGVSGSADRRQR